MKDDFNSESEALFRKRYDEEKVRPKNQIVLSKMAEMAALKGYADIIRDLHSRGIKLAKQTIYSHACHRGHIEIVKFISENQGDPKNNAFFSAGFWGQREIAEYLLTRDRQPNDLSNGLSGAAMGGHLDLVKLFAFHGGDLRYNDGDALKVAYEEQFGEICEFLEVVKALNTIKDNQRTWENDHVKFIQECDGRALLENDIPIKDENDQIMFFIPYLAYAANIMEPKTLAAKIMDALPQDLSYEVAPQVSCHDLLLLLNLAEPVADIRKRRALEQDIKSLPDRMPKRPPLRRRFKK